MGSLTDRVESPTNHVAYHADKARIGLQYLMRLIERRTEFSHLVNALHDLQLCAMDTQSVAQEIIEHANREENLLGAQASTWRAAAKALYEIGLRGPCLAGDQDFKSRLPVKHLAASVDKDPGVIVPGFQRDAFIACNDKMRIILFSDEAEVITGVNKSDAMGLLPWELEPSLKETGGDKAIIGVVQNGTTYTVRDVPFVSSAGVYGKYNAMTEPLKNADGKRIGALSAIKVIGPVRRAA